MRCYKLYTPGGGSRRGHQQLGVDFRGACGDSIYIGSSETIARLFLYLVLEYYATYRKSCRIGSSLGGTDK